MARFYLIISTDLRAYVYIYKDYIRIQYIYGTASPCISGYHHMIISQHVDDEKDVKQLNLSHIYLFCIFFHFGIYVHYYVRETRNSIYDETHLSPLVIFFIVNQTHNVYRIYQTAYQIITYLNFRYCNTSI